MDKRFEIRRASVDDAAQVARVHVEATCAAYKNLYMPEHLASLSPETFTRRWADRERSHLALGNPYGVFLALDFSGAAIGFADVGPANAAGQQAKAEEARLFAIYLYPTYIGKGIGRKLLQTCVEYARQHGFCSLLADVLSLNSTARTFYERTGARALSESEHSRSVGGTELNVITYRWDSLPS
ncbi:MAG: N-acetyltransferase family protein [Candidatus Methylacidiphilales bacterium]|nr:GNAT family N-acetyltransferase [Candidatus Methylacidiphilales bacterium]